jgi:hypothetical protein
MDGHPGFNAWLAASEGCVEAGHIRIVERERALRVAVASGPARRDQKEMRG